MVGIDLSGRTAFVTGASQGLGATVAATLHRAGAAVVINYLADAAGRNRQLAEQLAGELGERAVALPADVRDAEQLRAAVAATLERWGRLDILVNNAGIIRDRSLKNMTADEWRDVIDTNLTGAFNACRAAAEVLADGGRVVNVASIAAAVGFFGQSNYAAAKAGVVALTKVLSRELARRRITANAVAPGVVLTEMGKSIPDEVRAEMLKNIPLGRFGEPREIADVVLFLCSDLAAYVTGQTIHVNGGWYSP